MEGASGKRKRPFVMPSQGKMQATQLRHQRVQIQG